MAEHLKFCLIVFGSFLVFHEFPSANQMIGIVLTISGQFSLADVYTLFNQLYPLPLV